MIQRKVIYFVIVATMIFAIIGCNETVEEKKADKARSALDVEIKALDSEYQAKKVALDSEYQMKRTKVFKDAIAKLNELKNVAMDKHDLDSAKRIHERMEELSKM